MATPESCRFCNFNFRTGDALTGAIYPVILPIFYQGLTGSDAPILIRFSLLAAIPSFDAIAPYHPTAVGIMTRVPKRPTKEHTAENINIAVFYSVTAIYSYIMPHLKQPLQNLMNELGLDLDYDNQDLTTPKGIGNYVTASIIEQLNQDAWNELGDRMNPALTERTDQGRRYWDYTDYEPVNTAYRLIDAGHW